LLHEGAPARSLPREVATKEADGHQGVWVGKLECGRASGVTSTPLPPVHMPPPQRPQLHPTLQCMASPGRKTNCEDEGTLPSNKMAPKTRMHRTDSREASFPIPSRPRVARGSAGPGPGRGSAVGKGPREALAGLLVVRSRRLLAHLSLTAIRSGDGGATAGAAPRGSRRPGARRDRGSAGSPWWTPHLERGPPSCGSSLGLGDPSLSLHHPHRSQQPATGSGRQWKPEWGWGRG
jgi:hypothetical protein